MNDMTDAELVEAVAREVLGMDTSCVLTEEDGNYPYMRQQYGDDYPTYWSPFTNANDLMMVLEKFNDFRIDRWHDGWTVSIWFEDHNIPQIEVSADTLARAVLEAALKARRGE